MLILLPRLFIQFSKFIYHIPYRFSKKKNVENCERKNFVLNNLVCDLLFCFAAAGDKKRKKFFVRKFRNSYFLYGNFQFPFIDGKKRVVDTDSCRVFIKSLSLPNRFIVKVIVNLLCNIINFPASKNPIK